MNAFSLLRLFNLVCMSLSQLQTPTCSLLLPLVVVRSCSYFQFDIIWLSNMHNSRINSWLSIFRSFDCNLYSVVIDIYKLNFVSFATLHIHIFILLALQHIFVRNCWEWDWISMNMVVCVLTLFPVNWTCLFFFSSPATLFELVSLLSSSKTLMDHRQSGDIRCMHILYSYIRVCLFFKRFIITFIFCL